mmetsp:Transcript_5009/g.14847  ORF Transcript_5009/g.14847 Transcript_5009/m.14847 type:complete len:95 (-) Transcript_5009:64-348(-)|eukprot:CAMPEP_0119270270 /NCGR_PEP_ID=MMETSP1329-20130426/7343_1 /TAXON_ID=114041 /ORGANISM="Genus nov. species nov., Strain RCC1024" /LENGTH=94 /DNA_ID=CAMNT_0007270287 /DNA_START=145 /DNA_END=429 /DNA_ORIENTATION=+
MSALRPGVELIVSCVVGVGASAGAYYTLQQSLRERRDVAVSALRGPEPKKPLPHDVLYAAPPPRQESEAYASFRRAWNGQLEAVRKTISDIFKK